MATASAAGALALRKRLSGSSSWEDCTMPPVAIALSKIARPENINSNTPSERTLALVLLASHVGQVSCPPGKLLPAHGSNLICIDLYFIKLFLGRLAC